MIAAVSQNGVIGLDNVIPWDYSEDLKFFKKMTINNVIVMGRKTFEGIGKALPKRDNIVLTSSETPLPNHPNLFKMKSIKEVVCKYDYIGSPDIWLIGGAGVYREGMDWVNNIYLTLTPQVIVGDNPVYFPWINPAKFQIAENFPLSSELTVFKYSRI